MIKRIEFDINSRWEKRDQNILFIRFFGIGFGKRTAEGIEWPVVYFKTSKECQKYNRKSNRNDHKYGLMASLEKYALSHREFKR